MRCPICKATATLENTVRIRNDNCRGYRYFYSCAICGNQFETLRPTGHEEALIVPGIGTVACDCGAVARHSKVVQVTGPMRQTSGRNETLYLCDGCLEIEQQIEKPARVVRQVTWRAVYSGGF